MNYEIEIKLKQLLTEAELTQTELSNRTGLGGRTISVLVNNKIERVPISALSKISKELQLTDIRDLIDFKK